MIRRIAIACDHGGFDLKEQIKARFDSFDWLDLGTDSGDSVDYPDYGFKMGEAIANGDATQGIVICGTGIGISIAANRNPAVRCGLCTDTTMARLTRAHNDANVLALGARITGVEAAMDIVATFLNTDFEGGRHARRVDKLKG
ncbi:MAG: ribose 5-phosphate isomerase B [Bdellovibrionales bacterium]